MQTEAQTRGGDTRLRAIAKNPLVLPSPTKYREHLWALALEILNFTAGHSPVRVSPCSSVRAGTGGSCPARLLPSSDLLPLRSSGGGSPQDCPPGLGSLLKACPCQERLFLPTGDCARILYFPPTLFETCPFRHNSTSLPQGELTWGNSP